jgi:2,4-dienoyl-CoA reductase-like NADH-dependent reductase (Old Yellow Enzyme family)
MWWPPERIRHSLPVLRAPTPDEAARARLFSPLNLRSGVTLQERSWIPAMVPWRATEEGSVTSAVLDWYARFAEGEPGAIVIEATGIRDVPSGPLLRIGHDRFVPGLRELVDVVRKHSGGRTKLFVQLIDFLRIRRRPDPAKYFARIITIRAAHRVALGVATDEEARAILPGLDDVALERVLDERELEALRFGERERVTDLDREHIRELPRVLPALFADSAARAREAGFDGVELHYAHAYTMASFLSRKNDRSDGYGGPRENRVRLPVEVYRAVRERVGDDYAIGARFLCDEIIEGGSDVDDAAFFGVELARAGLDFLSLSTGGKFEDCKQPKVGDAAYPYTGRSGYECMPTTLSDERGPFARNVPKQARVRAAIRDAGLATPVVVAGGIHSFEQAEAILASGQGDLIGAARQSLADPDWFKKLRLGRGDEVRRCLYTNYCEALDQKHKSVTCQRWDKDPGGPRTEDGRRRLIAPPWQP